MTLIRQEYKEQLIEYRKGNEEWGSSAVRNAGDHVVQYINKHKGISTVLDFGCGTGALGAHIRKHCPDVVVYEYDPSIPGKDALPSGTFDLIASVDVMEHVEPNDVFETLEWIARHSVRQFHHIDCNDTADRLPDGRDVHLTVKPPGWWQCQIAGPEVTLMYFSEIHQRKRGRFPRTSCTIIVERGSA